MEGQGKLPGTTGVLCSAGLDSAVLVWREAQRVAVLPIYVAAGLAWEAAEQQVLARLVAAARTPCPIHPPAVVDLTMRDVYPAGHWAIAGNAPAYDTPDEDVYLEGRNIVLFAKAGVVCAARGIDRIAHGTLAGNPFPDATPAFFESMTRTLSLGLARPMTIETPFARMKKAEVIRLGRELGVPFEHTLSCMSPVNGRHCGRCSKCRERREAFAEAGVDDPVTYGR